VLAQIALTAEPPIGQMRSKRDPGRLCEEAPGMAHAESRLEVTMKKIKPMRKQLSLSKETIRSLATGQLDHVVGGIIVPSDGGTAGKTSCNTACKAESCAVC
jgi:hypothetical protein